MINQRVLITGSTGFVGKRFIQLSHNFKNNNYYILLDRNRSPSKKFFCNSLHGVIFSDFNNHFELFDIFSKFDVIVHLIGYFSDSCSTSDKFKMNAVNAKLSCDFAKIAKKSGVKKFIYISSYAAYLCENKKSVQLCDCYGRSKLSAEIELKKISSDLFKVVVIRPTALFGVNHTGSIYQLSMAIKKGKYIHFSPLAVSANFYFIDDFVYLLFKCIHIDVERFLIINASYGHYPILNFVEKIKEVLGQNGKFIKLHYSFMLPVAIIFSIFSYSSSKVMPFSYRKYKVMTSNVFLPKNVDFKEPFGMDKGLELTVSFFKENKMI